MSKIVARSIRNAEYQRLKDDNLAILFFRESCPFCKDFKPTWNRIARSLDKMNHHHNNDASSSYDNSISQDESSSLVVAKLDVTKFPAVKNYIQFPTVPCIALYKRGKPVLFLTTQDRSLPNIVSIIENYYGQEEKLPAETDFVTGTKDGQYPNTIENATTTPQQQITAPPLASIQAVVKKPEIVAANAMSTKKEDENEFNQTMPPNPLINQEEDKKNKQRKFNQEIKKRQEQLVKFDHEMNQQKKKLEVSLEKTQQDLKIATEKLQNIQNNIQIKQVELETISQKLKEVSEKESLKDQDCAARFLNLLLKRRDEL